MTSRISPWLGFVSQHTRPHSAVECARDCVRAAAINFHAPAWRVVFTESNERIRDKEETLVTGGPRQKLSLEGQWPSVLPRRVCVSRLSL